jgi:hypothetical protein
LLEIFGEVCYIKSLFYNNLRYVNGWQKLREFSIGEGLDGDTSLKPTPIWDDLGWSGMNREGQG